MVCGHSSCTRLERQQRSIPERHTRRGMDSTSALHAFHRRPAWVLSQSSIFGAKSKNRVSEIQWLTDSQNLGKATLRHIWTRPRCQGGLEKKNTCRDRCRHISDLAVKIMCIFGP